MKSRNTWSGERGEVIENEHTLYSLSRLAVSSSSLLLPPEAPFPACFPGASTMPMASLRRRSNFSSGVSCHESPPPAAAGCDGPLAPRPVWNLRLFSFVGSTRCDQSPPCGARVIHSSRFAGAAVVVAVEKEEEDPGR